MEKDELMRLAENWCEADTPEDDIRRHDILESAITSALASAHAAGRRKGLEEAAKISPWHYDERIRALIDSPTKDGK